jgi:hypothetical protein
MSTWTWLLILGFGLVKLPIALVMLWLPFRSDEAVRLLGPSDESGSSDEDDGGSKTLADSPHRPNPHRPPPRPWRRPRGPRRGPHGTPGPSAPARLRHSRAMPKRATHLGA